MATEKTTTKPKAKASQSKPFFLNTQQKGTVPVCAFVDASIARLIKEKLPNSSCFDAKSTLVKRIFSIENITKVLEDLEKTDSEVREVIRKFADEHNISLTL